MLTRRTLLGLSIALAGVGDVLGAAGTIEPTRLEDGRYTQPWFLNSFLVLKEDLAEATARGKRFAVMWDQRGCPYCMEMHKVNLADPEVNKFIRERFDIVQLDMFGSREVTDFDGQVLTEKDLARKYGVVGTPTIQFFPEQLGGKTGRAAEVARMPGYFKPAHFNALFAFVAERAYENQTFAQYMKAKAANKGL